MVVTSWSANKPTQNYIFYLTLNSYLTFTIGWKIGIMVNCLCMIDWLIDSLPIVVSDQKKKKYIYNNYLIKKIL